MLLGTVAAVGVSAALAIACAIRGKRGGGGVKPTAKTTGGCVSAGGGARAGFLCAMPARRLPVRGVWGWSSSRFPP